MESYIINGGVKLKGKIPIQGSKNSSVAVLIAALITEGTTEFHGIPDISDVSDCITILQCLGCNVEIIDKSVIRVNTAGAENGKIPDELLCRMRASSYLIGALLSKFGICDNIISGGCDFGSRPLDLHILAMEKLGAKYAQTEYGELLSAPQGLHGGEISFPVRTVGGTINAMIASAKADGITIIRGAACEPHISDVALFLNRCGADIRGAGSDTIVIHGVKKLHGCNFTVCSDMIEAGTFITYSLLTGGDITCNNAPVSQLGAFIELIKDMGANIETGDNSVRVRPSALTPSSIYTAPYPGFPTDLHPQTAVLMSLADGNSELLETVFENRFRYLEPLRSLGLKAEVCGSKLTIFGNTVYKGGKVSATDLRGGAALVGAALCAVGTSVINEVSYIERGYSGFVNKLRALGADITAHK